MASVSTAGIIGRIGSSSSSSWIRQRSRQRKDCSASRNRFRVSCSSYVVDPYQTLRIQPNASESEVKKAFRQLALQVWFRNFFLSIFFLRISLFGCFCGFLLLITWFWSIFSIIPTFVEELTVACNSIKSMKLMMYAFETLISFLFLFINILNLCIYLLDISLRFWKK